MSFLVILNFPNSRKESFPDWKDQQAEIKGVIERGLPSFPGEVLKERPVHGWIHQAARCAAAPYRPYVP